MKKLILATLFLFIFALPCLAAQYKVLRVIDGDTIDIDYNGKKERIRFLSVDTPESVHPDQSKNTEMGRKVSKYTKKRLAGKSVDLVFEDKKRGNYGRLLAYVYLNGQNFNLELVREGWSPYYTKYGNSEKYHTKFVAAEKEAKAKGLKIWGAKQQPIKTSLATAIIYHGNIKSHKFHEPSCRWYNCKNCTRVFNSIQAAIEAGYIPCKVCKP